jgi:hypothetical protein
MKRLIIPMICIFLISVMVSSCHKDVITIEQAPENIVYLKVYDEQTGNKLISTKIDCRNCQYNDKYTKNLSCTLD